MKKIYLVLLVLALSACFVLTINADDNFGEGIVFGTTAEESDESTTDEIITSPEETDTDDVTTEPETTAPEQSDTSEGTTEPEQSDTHW